jgi:hypothetical protein
MAWEELRELGLTVRPIEHWPGARTPDHARVHSPFKAGWQVTVRDLLRELRALDAKQTVLNLAVTDADLRVDGLPRANARLSDAGVVVAFDSMHGPLRYACDRFWSWQENLRAIALGLEALRKVSRYGIATDGQQYRGYRELEPHRMDPFEARIVLREVVNAAEGPMTTDGMDDRTLRTKALKAAHPDMGGDAETFDKVRMAVRALQ